MLTEHRSIHKHVCTYFVDISFKTFSQHIVITDTALQLQLIVIYSKIFMGIKYIFRRINIFEIFKIYILNVCNLFWCHQQIPLLHNSRLYRIHDCHYKTLKSSYTLLSFVSMSLCSQSALNQCDNWCMIIIDD